MLKIISVLLIVLTFIKFEFLLRFDIFFDAYQKFGSIKLYFFSIKIFSASIFIESEAESKGKIILKIGRKEKQLKISRESNKEKNAISISTIKNMFSNLLITELGFEARIGDKNALRAIMLLSSVRVFFYSGVSVLKSRHNVNIYEKFIPYYNRDIFAVDAYGILNISLADIIFSISMNSVRKLRHIEGKERNQQI